MITIAPVSIFTQLQQVVPHLAGGLPQPLLLLPALPNLRLKLQPSLRRSPRPGLQPNQRLNRLPQKQPLNLLPSLPPPSLQRKPQRPNQQQNLPLRRSQR